MGRDKAKIRLEGRSLLSHVRRTALRLNVPVRVIRRDVVPRCGPLGGVLTGLQSTRAEVVLFLACDMPWVPAVWLRRLLRGLVEFPGIFTMHKGQVGFPFVVRTQCRPTLEKARKSGQHALHEMAALLKARKLKGGKAYWFRNLNRPEDLKGVSGF